MPSWPFGLLWCAKHRRAQPPVNAVLIAHAVDLVAQGRRARSREARQQLQQKLLSVAAADMACDWGKLLEQLQGQTKTKIQALDTLQVTAGPLLAAGWLGSARAGATAPQPSTDAAAQNHVQTTALGRDNISSLLDYTPQLLSDNNFKASWLKETCLCEPRAPARAPVPSPANLCHCRHVQCCCCCWRVCRWP